MYCGVGAFGGEFYVVVCCNKYSGEWERGCPPPLLVQQDPNGHGHCLLAKLTASSVKQCCLRYRLRYHLRYRPRYRPRYRSLC